MKRALLELEGVHCDDAGRVARARLYYGETLPPEQERR